MPWRHVTYLARYIHASDVGSAAADALSDAWDAEVEQFHQNVETVRGAVDTGVEVVGDIAEGVESLISAIPNPLPDWF